LSPAQIEETVKDVLDAEFGAASSLVGSGVTGSRNNAIPMILSSPEQVKCVIEVTETIYDRAVVAKVVYNVPLNALYFDSQWYV
jgi:hypothetical protein